MKRRCAKAIILAVIDCLLIPGTTFGADVSVDDRPFEEIEQDDGISFIEKTYRRTSTKGYVSTFSLAWVTLDPEVYDIRFYHASEGFSLARLERHLGSEKSDRYTNGDYVIISGGFLSQYNPVRSAGYVKLDGKTVNEPVNAVEDSVLSGVACVSGKIVKGSSKNERRLLPYLPDFSFAPPPEEFEAKYSRFESCLQSGPYFFRSGKKVSYPPASKRQPGFSRVWRGQSERALIAKTSEGKVILSISSQGGATIDQLASMFREEKGISSVQHALNLQGGDSRGLIVSNKGGVVRLGNTKALQATAIVARRLSGN